MVDRADGASQSQGNSAAAAPHARVVDPLSVTKRLQREGRWPEAEPVRDRLIKECRKQGMSKPDAQAWTYAELDCLYPPQDTDGKPGGDPQSEPAHCGLVTGLGVIPSSWPRLPANASLAAEIRWVQASRLDVVEERPNGSTVVHLDRASSPAPSKAAIGWLETSIRAYSKYCDIVAKVTATYQDEQDWVRRERLAIGEIRSLLAEMVKDGDEG